MKECLSVQRSIYNFPPVVASSSRSHGRRAVQMSEPRYRVYSTVVCTATTLWPFVGGEFPCPGGAQEHKDEREKIFNNSRILHIIYVLDTQ